MMGQKSLAALMIITAASLYLWSVEDVSGAPYGVKYTAHNMSKTAKFGQTFQAQSETEICIFCHTPHNAATGQKFLWNRNNPTTTFRPYTSTPWLPASAKTSMNNLSQVSRMCMSCHDGVTAINVMLTRPAGVAMVGGTNYMSSVWMQPCNTPGDPTCGRNIGDGQWDDTGTYPGNNLTNDHPVSFNYDDVLTHFASVGNSTLKPKATAETNGVIFWNGNMVECVTCHEPHVNYNASQGGDARYAKFLRRPNDSSGLCFACHDK